MTVYAASVTGTVNGTTVTWTPDNPPPAADLGTVSLFGATFLAAWVSLPSLTASELHQSTSFCTP
jgi:hypothetical protein